MDPLPPAEPPGALPTAAAAGGARIGRRGAALLAAVGLVAVLLYAHDLRDADRMYLDEKIYVPVAYQMANGVWEDPCAEGEAFDQVPANWVHPPLAKHLMAWSLRSSDAWAPYEGCLHLGEDRQAFAAFDQAMQDGDPADWRLPSVAFGVATVAFTALAASRLFGGAWAGPLAGALVLLDGVMFASARTAMLDIYATGFTMAAVWAATYANRWGVLGAGALLGLAFACKYTAAFAGLPVLLVAAWAHHRAGSLTPRSVRAALASLLGLPVLALLASYAPWWRLWVARHGVAWSVGHWLGLQRRAVLFLGGRDADVEYDSAPWTWLSLRRPVMYYGDDSATAREYIYGVGNPVVWWGAVAAVTYVLYRALQPAQLAWLRQAAREATRRARARLGRKPLEGGPAPIGLPGSPGQQALLLACVLPLLAYLPYLLLTRDGTFLYYMTAVVPFMAVALAGTAQHLWRSGGRVARVGCAAGLALAALAFWHYFPILDAHDITREEKLAILRILPWAKE